MTLFPTADPSSWEGTNEMPFLLVGFPDDTHGPTLHCTITRYSSTGEVFILSSHVTQHTVEYPKNNSRLLSAYFGPGIMPNTSFALFLLILIVPFNP